MRRTLRQPALIVPTIVFPLFLLAVNASGLSAATKIPGLPDRLLPRLRHHRPFMQGALFASITAGTELATDIETGFLNRLQLTPLRRRGVLVGQMAGAIALGAARRDRPTSRSGWSPASTPRGVGGALVLLALAV